MWLATNNTQGAPVSLWRQRTCDVSFELTLDLGNDTLVASERVDSHGPVEGVAGVVEAVVGVTAFDVREVQRSCAHATRKQDRLVTWHSNSLEVSRHVKEQWLWNEYCVVAFLRCCSCSDPQNERLKRNNFRNLANLTDLLSNKDFPSFEIKSAL